MLGSFLVQVSYKKIMSNWDRKLVKSRFVFFLSLPTIFQESCFKSG